MHEAVGAEADGERSLRDVAVELIRKNIVSGHYPPGCRLVEQQVAEELGMSRNPIREALRILEVEGFVAMRQRRGAVVATITEEEIEEFFEIRLVLEPLAARLASERASPASSSKLEDILQASEQALRQGDQERFGQYNAQFHYLIIQLAENIALRGVVQGLHSRAQWASTRIAARRREERSVQEHREIAEAINNGDHMLAETLAQAHIAKAWKSFRELRRNPDGPPGK